MGGGLSLGDYSMHNISVGGKASTVSVSALSLTIIIKIYQEGWYQGRRHKIANMAELHEIQADGDKCRNILQYERRDYNRKMLERCFDSKRSKKHAQISCLQEKTKKFRQLSALGRVKRQLFLPTVFSRRNFAVPF